jgi:hypothetical protein
LLRTARAREAFARVALALHGQHASLWREVAVNVLDHADGLDSGGSGSRNRSG